MSDNYCGVTAHLVKLLNWVLILKKKRVTADRLNLRWGYCHRLNKEMPSAKEVKFNLLIGKAAHLGV